MANKRKSSYKQLAKIGDKVLDIESRKIGVIKQIDNVCNVRDNNRTVNEYYVQWSNGVGISGWTRHDCYYLDKQIPDPGNQFNPPEQKVKVVLLTGVTKVLYGKAD